MFKSQIYRKSDKVFKHYTFLNAESKAEFNAYITGVKALALYDTGITASYGDALLTLVTCAYHTENGQLVVVARNKRFPPLKQVYNRAQKLCCFLFIHPHRHLTK